MTYEIEGTISFKVNFDIDDVNSEEEALQKAKERLNDYYRLKVKGAEHDPASVKVDIDAYELDDDE